MRNRSLISAILLFAVTLGTFSCGGHGDVSDSSSDGQTDSSAPEETKLSDTLEKKELLRNRLQYLYALSARLRILGRADRRAGR